MFESEWASLKDRHGRAPCGGSVMGMNILSLTPRKEESVVSVVKWLHERAEKCIDEEAYDEAIKHFSRLVIFEKEDPKKLAENYAFLGDIYLGLNDFSKAFRFFKKAIELDSSHPHYQYLMGFNFAQVKRWALAKGCFEKAHKMDKDNAEYLRGLGWTLVMLGEKEEGEVMLKKALKKDPNSLWALVDLGYSYYRRGAYKDAIPLFEEAILRDNSLCELKEVLESCRMRLVGSTRRTPVRELLSTSLSQSSVEIARLIRRKMVQSPYRHHLGIIKNALRLWDDFVYTSRPKVLAGFEGWAAAVEFLMVQLEYPTKPVIEALSARFGTESPEVLRKARVICQSLKVSLDDARYVTRLQFSNS